MINKEDLGNSILRAINAWRNSRNMPVMSPTEQEEVRSLWVDISWAIVKAIEENKVVEATGFGPFVTGVTMVPSGETVHVHELVLETRDAVIRVLHPGENPPGE